MIEIQHLIIRVQNKPRVIPVNLVMGNVLVDLYHAQMRLKYGKECYLITKLLDK